MCEEREAKGGCSIRRTVSITPVYEEAVRLIVFRYDSLLEHFKQPAMHSQSRRVFGVGMSIAVE